MLPILTNNLFNLLRAGAFEVREPFYPMSFYKWKKIVCIAEALQLKEILMKGILIYRHDQNLNIPQPIVDELRRDNTVNVLDGYDLVARLQDIGEFKMNSKRLSNILHAIIDSEKQSMECNEVSLEFLEIMVRAWQAMVDKEVSLPVVIILGIYLRTLGHKIDFIKVENWFFQLRLRKVANLHANILIEYFGFEKDEIPFYTGKDNRAKKLVDKILDSFVSESYKHGNKQIEESDGDDSSVSLSSISDGEISEETSFSLNLNIKRRDNAIFVNTRKTISLYSFLPKDVRADVKNHLFKKLENIEE